MNKLKPKDFAELLLEMTENHSEDKQKEYLKEFVALVFKKRMQGKINEIIAEYRKLYNAKHGIVEATVTLTDRLSEATRLKLREALKKKYKAREVHMLEKVDQRLIGGMKVKVGDTVHDASLGHVLTQLHKQLVA
jgi:F-type H+-transporting ATPase subunit delta